MPLYEYVCARCSHPFEELVSGDASPACPKCASDKVQRVMSAFAVGRAESPAPVPTCGAGACGACGDPRGPGACSN